MCSIIGGCPAAMRSPVNDLVRQYGYTVVFRWAILRDVCYTHVTRLGLVNIRAAYNIEDCEITPLLAVLATVGNTCNAVMIASSRYREVPGYHSVLNEARRAAARLLTVLSEYLSKYALRLLPSCIVEHALTLRKILLVVANVI